MRSDLHELPFDQFQRYKTVQDCVQSIRPEPGSKLKVLDVGGYPGLIVDFLPDDDVTVVDVLEGNFPNYVQASGAKLPFEDESFDLVCSCDTLEHVKKEDRRDFIAELARVSRDFIIITAPFGDHRTELAEEILYSYVLKVLRVEFATLKEHIDNGLPDLESTTAHLADMGIVTENFPSGHLYNWLSMMMAKHHLMAHPGTDKLHRQIDLFYNQNFSQDDNREPSYRRVIVGSKKDGEQVAAFCRQFKAETDGAASSAADFGKLELFRLIGDFLDLDLKRNVTDLVEHLKAESDQELVRAKETLSARDQQISDLQNIIEAQNQSLDELHALVARVRNFLPYRAYSKLFKRR